MLNLPKAFNTGLSVDPDIRFSLGVEHTGHGDRTPMCKKKQQGMVEQRVRLHQENIF